MLKLKLLQAGELRADAVRDGTWFWDEVKPEDYGEELRTCAAGKRGVSVLFVRQLPIINFRAHCCLLVLIRSGTYPLARCIEGTGK